MSQGLGAYGSRQSDTIMVKRCRVVRWKREVEWYLGWGKRQTCRGEGGEKQANLNGMLATPESRVIARPGLLTRTSLGPRP